MPPEAGWELRNATADDVDMIRELVRSAYAKWVPVIGREPLPMRADYERAVQEHQIDLAFVDGRLVGLIEMILRDYHLWIENLAVRPQEQGKGFGRRLLAHAERRAIEAGRVETRLLTNAEFKDNVALYEKSGYRVVSREPFMDGTTVYMSKRLSVR
ncbi:MAG TPA: GNAT family N-acetyltransferase [Roseiarcus sp.]|jgi:GNAT superfamily N-acetyltransferase